MDLLSNLPAPVRWAIILTAANAIVSLAVVFLIPDLEERGTMIVVGSILSAAFLAACWFAATAPRWGGVALIGVNALNLLLSLPMVVDIDPALLVVGAITSVLPSVAAIALMFFPEARAFRRASARPATA